MASNRYKVDPEKWAKWGKQGQSVFNEVFSTLRDNQGHYLHPKQQPAPSRHWSTTAWNAAWTAADAATTNN